MHKIIGVILALVNQVQQPYWNVINNVYAIQFGPPPLKFSAISKKNLKNRDTHESKLYILIAIARRYLRASTAKGLMFRQFIGRPAVTGTPGVSMTVMVIECVFHYSPCCVSLYRFQLGNPSLFHRPTEPGKSWKTHSVMERSIQVQNWPLELFNGI